MQTPKPGQGNGKSMAGLIYIGDNMTEEETQDAMEMLGKGYEHPSVVIEPPHVTMERRDNAFKEVITPAFVKISTDFKDELATIDEVALKVWLYIALSVNRYSGKANPGLRTIAKGTGFAINTIQAALKRLETTYNLLTVDRESRKYNIYEPLAFVSANRNTPSLSVSADDTPQVGGDESVSNDAESVSVEPESVSVLDESVSARVILNQRNQNNQKEPDAAFSSKESTQNVFKVYQNNIAMLTSATADALEDDEKTYGPDWVCSAIQEAALSEVHSLKYVEAILKRWKRDGYKSTKTKQEAQAWTGRTLN
jgi:DnaD/phage-associated family protein